jgi:hypothetical protein
MNANELKDLERRTARRARAFGWTVAAVGAVVTLAAVFTPGWSAVVTLAAGVLAFNAGLGIVLEAQDDDDDEDDDQS